MNRLSTPCALSYQAATTNAGRVRREAIEALASACGIPVEQARAQVAELEASYECTVNRVAAAAARAANAAATWC
ncbi:hypothetical protein [Acuticoccus sediminis]|uniref:hypothetical protein n=1 Tax=Acuticoccus sediminis TaxID=2184697 RepID=UPI0011B94BD4|nr:hypothetical protein [Acuticoccus sediminis]